MRELEVLAVLDQNPGKFRSDHDVCSALKRLTGERYYRTEVSHVIHKFRANGLLSIGSEQYSSRQFELTAKADNEIVRKIPGASVRAAQDPEFTSFVMQYPREMRRLARVVSGFDSTIHHDAVAFSNLPWSSWSLAPEKWASGKNWLKAFYADIWSYISNRKGIGKTQSLFRSLRNQLWRAVHFKVFRPGKFYPTLGILHDELQNHQERKKRKRTLLDQRSDRVV